MLVVPLVPPAVRKLPVAPAVRAASELKVVAMLVVLVPKVDSTVPSPALKVSAPMAWV